MPRYSVTVIVFVCTAVLAGPGSNPPTLDIENRVEAQRTIERVLRRHQIGTRLSFEAAAPEEIERRTRSTLGQSLALERFWGTPVTVEALQREMDRIRQSTLFPDRLREIEVALGNDPALILETFARASLVDRLARSFFAYDERIHESSRSEATRLREKLLTGAIDLRAPHPGRTVIELRRIPGEGQSGAGAASASISPVASSRSTTGPLWGPDERISLSAADYEARRAAFPASRGVAGELVEERDRFLVRAVLEEDANAARVATWNVPKKSFDVWWSEVEHDFPAEAVRATRRKSDSKVTEIRRPQSRAKPRDVEEPPVGSEREPLCGRDDTWDTTPFDAHPHNMAGHTAVWTGEEMIVWGGRDIGGYRYDPLIDHWIPMSVSGAPGAGPLVWTGEEVIVWDGESGGRYDPALDAWAPISNADAPLGRKAHSVVWTGAEVIVWGGYHRDPPSGFQTDLRSGGRYDPATDAWHPMTTVQAPSARQSHTALWTGDVMVVLGGYPSTAQGGRYDPRTDTWLPTTTVGARDALSAVWAGSEVILLSRESSWFSSFTVARRYDPVRDTYAPLAVPEDIGGSMVWSGEEVIVWAEDGGGGNRYNPATSTWKRIQSLNAPRPRTGSSMLWAGDRLIVWGGGSEWNQGSDGAGTGGRYDPVADAWTPTATPAGPARNAGPEAVWTGSEMIVWNPYAHGAARFDPLTAQWKSISTVGAPGSYNIVWTGQEALVFGGFAKQNSNGHSDLAIEGARYDPIANAWRPMKKPPYKAWRFPIVWTGTELLAWGGRTSSPESDNDHTTNSGLRYDPVSDEWTLMSRSGAPIDRENHVVVWTGREMIVWGGEEARCWDRSGTFWPDCDHPEGGRYDPVTDTWRTMSRDGPMTARNAVWTGREMILWDGDQSKTYDPADDSWRYLPTDHAPPGSYGASVTMADKTLIVWGGESAGNLTQEGARFDPVTGVWTPMSTSAAPTPRAGHSAVWTGRGLIVWGGTIKAPAQTMTGTGGMYFLTSDRDHDGFSSCAGDCDDDNPLLHPGAIDLPGNTRDEDCDGAIACDPGDYPLHRGALTQCVVQECRRLKEAGRLDPDECRAAFHRSTGGPECGDGVASSQEVCDGEDLRGATCASLGYDAGALGCNAACDGFDLSGCATVCGDGRRAGRESCDGSDLGGATCATAGFDAGMLACTPTCGAFDVTNCTTVCGDGAARGTEVCDGEDFGGRTCATLGFDDGTLTCGPRCGTIDVSGCTTICGNGRRAGYEACDGADLAGRTCQSLGYEGGTLSCNAACSLLDESGCSTCEDGFATGTEACDGDDLRGETCQSQGLERGRLRCNYECNGFELDGCVGCGNGVREGDELCDTYDIGGKNCTTFGFEDSWGLKCNATCDGYDVSRCASCGDGVAQPQERCDGADQYGQTCQGEGFDGGTLGCRADCSAIDTAGCTTLCGDGVQRGAEQCDRADLDHRSCWSLGYDNGVLACGDNCAFDTSGCSRCGNGIIEPGEDCEGNDLNCATCESLGFSSGSLSCSSCKFSKHECVAGCGNGAVDQGEICDGPPRASCEDLGFDAGWGLGCKSTCDGYDVSSCWTCGDGIRHPEEEACDGEDVRGYTCAALGFDGGTLGCASDCDGFDTSGCTTVCGDGVRRGNEKCDGDDVPSHCGYYGSNSGTLACNATCDGFDTSGCDVCGDGVKDPTEVCDLADLGGATCETFGFTGGTLRCSGYCRQLDFSGCTGCGNKVREGQEVCDGADLGGATCQNVDGYTGGTLSCNSLCDGLDVSGCTRCGDGFRNPVGENYEYCDGGDLGGRTCEMYGFLGGTLTCGADCRSFDTSACATVCGDGLVAGSEICDGRDFGGLTCKAFGSPGGGPLFCNATCDAIDPSHCLPCGDGIIQGEEQCDSDNLRGGTCRSFGYSLGTLRCSAQCTFDTSYCYNPGNPPDPPPTICGDHRRSGPEVCDGADVGGQSCIGLGFDGGYLLCNETCDALDLTTCSTCGDNVRTLTERCDGTDLGGETCQTLGFASGTLACTADCSGLDKTGCH